MTTINSSIQSYVESLTVFKASSQSVTDAEELSWRIWKILTDEQRLARRPDAKLKASILGKIKTSIAQQEPIALIDTVGGFKNYAAPSAPHIDWSEIFMLNKLLKQCVKIAAIYKPGVWLEFSGDTYMLPFFDNIPKKHIDTYVSDFNQLINIFQQHLPTNVKVTQKNVDEFYNLEDLQKRIRSQAERLTSEEVDALVKKNSQKAAHNFMIKGIKDYSNISKEDMKSVLRESIVLDHLYIDIDVQDRFEYIEGGTHVPLIQTAIPGCIALKSVNTSKLAFWLGSGYLRNIGGKFIPYIQHGQKWHELRDLQYAKVESPFEVIPGLDSIPYQP